MDGIFGSMTSYFQPWFLQNQYHAVVVDIGAGGAGNDQIVELLEESIGVMDGEQRCRVEALLGCALQGMRRDNCPGIVFSAVNAICIAGEGMDISLPRRVRWPVPAKIPCCVHLVRGGLIHGL